VILADSNIPMYLVGESHPHKVDAQRLLERLIAERVRLVTDAAVMQQHEIETVLSFDDGFDAVPGMSRLSSRS
jgi:predicted nucleic acid-binding protein